MLISPQRQKSFRIVNGCRRVPYINYEHQRLGQQQNIILKISTMKTRPQYPPLQQSSTHRFQRCLHRRIIGDRRSLGDNYQINPSIRRKRGTRRISTRKVAVFFLIFLASVWLLFIYNYRNALLNSNGSNEEGDEGRWSISTQTPTIFQLQQKRKEDPATFLTMYGRHRYDPSFEALPKWLQDYFTWHQSQTKKITESQHQHQKNNNKYVVLLCLPKDTLCGGISDRLRPLLFYLFIAKQSNRILCIYYDKPFGLDQFLQPIPQIGIDWRCPTTGRDLYELDKPYDKQPQVPLYRFGFCKKNTMPFAECIEKDLEGLIHENNDYVTLDLATHDHDCVNNANALAQKHSYDSIMPVIAHWGYPEMIKDIFRVMFEPIPELAKRINSTMTQLGLVENQYITTHVRARYPAGYIIKYLNNGRNQTFDKDGGLVFEGKLKDYMVSIVDNAVNCGHLLDTNLKIFFVSDHNQATEFAIANDNNNKFDNKEPPLRVVSMKHEEEPLHMDGNHNQKAKTQDFYSVFEDLLIMGGSKCVSHGIGSFGSFGAGLTGNRCRAIHRKYSSASIQCPNDRGDRRYETILDKDMTYGEKPRGPGKIKFIL